MTGAPTTADLVQAKALTIDDIRTLIAAYEAHPGPGPLPLGADDVIDVAQAIESHPADTKVLFGATFSAHNCTS